MVNEPTAPERSESEMGVNVKLLGLIVALHVGVGVTGTLRQLELVVRSIIEVAPVVRLVTFTLRGHGKVAVVSVFVLVPSSL